MDGQAVIWTVIIAALALLLIVYIVQWAITGKRPGTGAQSTPSPQYPVI